MRASANGLWVTIDGRRVDIASSPTYKTRILARLLHSSAPLSATSLIAAGWPGDKSNRNALATRLYTAISALRREGLIIRLLLRRCDNVYVRGYVLGVDRMMLELVMEEEKMTMGESR